MSWSGPEWDYDFFKTGPDSSGGYGADISRHSGTCGLFRGDGADTSGAGLCSAGDQWGGRRSGHTQTVWKLLERYQIPVFLFINKMDQNGTDRARVLAELKNRLSGNCVDFTTDQALDEWMENVAVCDEAAMEWYLEKGSLPENTIAELVSERKVFPCYFGSALKLTGVQEFLEGLEKYTREPSYGQEFAARVYKIARDDQGNRLTYVKITEES